MDFELLATGLRKLLQLMGDDLRELRSGHLQTAQQQWEGCTVSEQEEWLRRLENMRQALVNCDFKKDGKLLEAIDELFLRPPPRARACVQPYWKGSPDAPIAVRPHVVKDTHQEEGKGG